MLSVEMAQELPKRQQAKQVTIRYQDGPHAVSVFVQALCTNRYHAPSISICQTRRLHRAGLSPSCPRTRRSRPGLSNRLTQSPSRDGLGCASTCVVGLLNLGSAGRQPTGSRFPQPDCCFASVWPGVTPRLAHCSASFGIVDVSRSTGYPLSGSHGK